MRVNLLPTAALLICSVAAATDPPPADQLLTREQVVADLEFFRDQWAPKDLSFSEENRAAMLKLIATEIDRAQPTRAADLALTFERAMALSGNNHTHTEYFFYPRTFSVVPI